MSNACVRVVWSCVGLASWLLCACGGQQGSEQGPSGGGGASPTPNKPIPTDPQHAALQPARRLNRAELASAISASFGVKLRAGSGPPDAISGRFDRDGEHFDIDPGVAEAYLDVAIETARAAKPATLSGCSPTVTRECVKTYLQKTLSVWLRRPTASADVDSFLVTFDEGAARSGGEEGLRAVIARAVLSPDFLYVIEPAVGKGDEAPLTPYALATRLAFAMWREPPDAALFAKAAGGASASELVQAVLNDPRVSAGLLAFHTQWLDLVSARNADMHMGAPAGVGAALVASLNKWVQHAYEKDLPLASLLGGNGLFAEPAVGTLLGLTPATGQLVDRRAGILLHPGFLAARAHENETSPILRGAFMAERIACAPLVQPDLDLTANPVDPSLPTTRARVEQQTKAPACAGCHGIINPLGFAFEGYDHLGRPRMTDGTQPIDTSGKFMELGVEGTFRNADEMLDRLLPSKVVASCFAQRWLEYTSARIWPTDRPYDEAVKAKASSLIDNNVGVKTFLAQFLASKAVTTIAAP